MADFDDNELAQLLLALRNDVHAQDDIDPPAQILDVVPAHGEPVDREDEDHRRRGLLLSSLGPITAMMGAGFVYITKLFEYTDYDVATIFRKPQFGEFIIHLTPKQKQVFCANTAYYIDAMRHNKQLEVITEEGVQKFKPLSSSGSTAVTLTPSSTMTLHGNEVIQKNEISGKLVYKQEQTEILVPEDPIEISAFCMAHFFNTENVQILMNWGEDFKLISEADLLRLLGELGQRNDWKQRIVGKIIENAYYVYNQTGPYFDYISSTEDSIRDRIMSAPSNIQTEFEIMTEYTLPRYKEQVLNNIARNYPKVWAVANTVNDYPIQSSLFALFVLYYLRKPLGAVSTVLYEAVRLPFRILSWLTGRNPDRDERAIEDVRGGGKQHPLTVIVINHPLPQLYIDKLSELFDVHGSIAAFVKHIDSKKGESVFQPLDKKRKRIMKYEIPKKMKLAPRSVPEDPRSIAEIEGGKRKITRRRSNSTKRKHQNKRKTHKR